MAERFSTGYRNAQLVTGSVKDIMQDGVIGIYSGSQPTSADDAENGDLLMLITLNAGAFTGGVATNGLEMGTATSGVLAKAAAETWKGVGTAAASTGTIAGWFRWYDNNYTTGTSTTAVRVDGQIGTTSSFELQLSTTTIVENGEAIITSFNFTYPAS